ncbi:hypothetical protein FRACYDRAFT_261156 [Fragilariopsis cylindrus CCMP1102]|uniref:EF-hand domain-containing protein n=1 Tax=Fragilariopsis cylindrus CCMP1102 TaxID=635003 RepID=A0A1E7FDM6_9STRA|nr:hypothetical protein FRACYDRAFT_261156 [Fragilariopsis cylindrus CCMP1102]|eukprot:OEU16249.1 hypothetical protein FRACYDRAFT_261156 [Fragilariopsis cylindrus CCMP1102]
MAIGPTIDPADVGTTGLIWLFFSYGYALFYSANLIGEGSELLLLVPSMAGLVGGVVLPLLGAVPDGAIILFSGLGSIEVAQDSLSVGIGALAGSTIMLLTIPWALSVFAGRVDIINGNPNYRGKIKLFPGKSTSETLRTTGVAVSDEIRHGGIVMALTTIPYFLIQIPAMFMHGPTEEVAEGEHWWALGSLLMCLIGLVAYMVLQLKFNDAGQTKDKRIAIAKKTLQEGKMSLKGVVKSTIKTMESKRSLGSVSDGTGYGAIPSDSEPSPEILSELKELLHDAFRAYDSDGNGTLEKHEIRVFLKDFHENIDEDTVNEICARVDKDNDNLISLDEFVILCYYLIMSDDDHSTKNAPVVDKGFRASIQAHVFKDDDGEGDDDEVEDIPEDFTDLSPEDQQSAIKLRAFKMLFVGTLMVVYFSDPMVDVMQEIAVKCSIPPFYVSFVLAPLASNSSEVIASMFYAAKKTRKTMTVSLSALEGAACMNNTFCLCIFMGLIYARGLAWQYTAETASIVVVQFIMALLVQKDVMTCGTALGVLAIFPLSLVFVFTMENYLGFD